MNFVSCVVLIVVAAAVAAAVRCMWKNRGKSCCDCDKIDCPGRRG